MVSDVGKGYTRVESAADGRYQISGLAPGRYTLIASAQEHLTQAKFILVGRGASSLQHDFILQAVD